MPGDDFGRSGRGHVRLSFGGPIEELRTGMSRIVEFTKLQLWTLKPAHRQR
jgi:aspartate/methionine/tyrosine aminotransferase